MASKVYLTAIALNFVVYSNCQDDSSVFEPNHPGANQFDVSETSNSFVDSPPFRYVTPETVEADIPIILWWTGRLFMGHGLKQLNCPSAVCYSTNNRKYLNDPRTYGLYFYGTDIDPEDMPLPRKPHHEWALYHEESPMNNYMLVHKQMLQLFNHTATFRRESDYPLTSMCLLTRDYLLDRNPVSIEEKNLARKEGYAPVLFAQSHCDIASDRERYVKELMKYIDVDSVGSCIHNKDIPKDIQDPVKAMEDVKFLDLISKYKFHLAFENALCKDYMTEKLFRPLHVGSVPICRGSELARDWMPNNKSVIMVDDFGSPEELAKFLLYLDSNDDEYQSYLEYKNTGITNEFLDKHLKDREWGVNEIAKPDSLRGFECHICEKLNERYKVEKIHRKDPSVQLLSPKMATTSHMNCPQPYPAIGLLDDIPRTDGWRDHFWIEDYWGGLDKALALQDMIANNEKDSRMFMEYWERIMEKNRHF